MTTDQDYFPIIESSSDEKEIESVTAFGVIERHSILSAIAQGEGQSTVTTLINDTIRTVSADETVTSLFYELHPDEESVCMVQQNGNYTGLVFPNKIAHIVWIKSIKDLVEL
jgi:predicted transcriptional regulator